MPKCSLKQITLCCLLLVQISATSIASGQSKADEQAVMIVVDKFFAALEARDEQALELILYPGSLNISATMQSDAGNSLSVRSYEDLLSRFAEGPPIVERYWDHTLLIRGAIAVFWAPYDLYIGEDFSHCGADSFQLAKQDGRWWLSNLSWTIERENCVFHPDGPPP